MSESILSQAKTGELTMSGFFNAALRAADEGQASVDALIWGAMEDEVFRVRFNNALYLYTQSSALRVSVFSSPVLYRECVETVFEGAVGKSYFKALEISLLLQRADFDDELFARMVLYMSRNHISHTILFLDELWMTDKLTLGRLLAVYYLGAKEDGLVQARRINLTGEFEVYSVRGYVWEKLRSHYPDMPETWFRQMLQSLRQAG